MDFLISAFESCFAKAACTSPRHLGIGSKPQSDQLPLAQLADPRKQRLGDQIVEAQPLFQPNQPVLHS